MGFVPVSKVLPCGGTGVLRTPLYPQGLPRMTHLQHRSRSLQSVSSVGGHSQDSQGTDMNCGKWRWQARNEVREERAGVDPHHRC